MSIVNGLEIGILIDTELFANFCSYISGGVQKSLKSTAMVRAMKVKRLILGKEPDA